METLWRRASCELAIRKASGFPSRSLSNATCMEPWTWKFSKVNSSYGLPPNPGPGGQPRLQRCTATLMISCLMQRSRRVPGTRENGRGSFSLRGLSRPNRSHRRTWNPQDPSLPHHFTRRNESAYWHRHRSAHDALFHPPAPAALRRILARGTALPDTRAGALQRKVRPHRSGSNQDRRQEPAGETARQDRWNDRGTGARPTRRNVRSLSIQ